MNNLGESMHSLCRELFPICRSITGDGLRQSLNILKRELPDLQIFEVPTGTKCFDWEVPREWVIRDAYIITPSGEKICEFKVSNLHVMGYSTPVDKFISLNELQSHLHSLPDQPDAIPYVTSYYAERWGFCLSDNERKGLVEGQYKVYIDSELIKGSLSYGELIIKGDTKKEVFLSTDCCHPSMANNELSGPVVTLHLAKWLSSLSKRKYTYRIIFIPETIGSITYLSKNFNKMSENIIAGFNICCVGDNRGYSYLPSRNGETLSDKVALHVLENIHPDFKRYSFLDRGSDERQYCSPGIDLPVCSIMRSCYKKYPEYHTSLDDLNLVTPKGLLGAFIALQQAIECLEFNEIFCSTTLCEPQLGKRGLYPTLSTKSVKGQVEDMMNFIVYCDGTLNSIEICKKIGVFLLDMKSTIEKLHSNGLLKIV